MSKRTALSQRILVVALVLVETELISGPLRSRPLQTAVALPLGLYLPGAVLGRALGRQASDTLVDHIVTALGLSLAVLAVGGVALNLFAVGLRPMTWLVYLALVLLSAELVALARRDRTAVASAIRIPHIRIGELALGATIITLLTAAFAVAIIGAHRQRTPGFTQFWLIPQHGGANYQLGVASYTGHLETFDAILKVRGRSVRTWQVTLSSGKTWSAMVSLPPHVPASAFLLRTGSSRPYRQVFIRDTLG